ncbi:MAG: H-NS histone family protein [Betaproteobacteria bacterium]|nr:H-NS histone family protein [Betaproteobacteria bacterium]
MESYKELKARIAELEQQAEDLRRKELAVVIREIRERMAEYGLGAADLGFGDKTAGKSKGAPKFRDPSTGKTWSGYGKAPNWIKAHEAAGGNRNDLRIG